MRRLEVAEDVVSVRLELVLHGGFLPASVQQQLAQEVLVRVLSARRLWSSPAARVSRQEVGEDDQAHRRLARSGLAHRNRWKPIGGGKGMVYVEGWGEG